MKSKKILIITPALLMALTACGGGATSSTASNTTSASKEYISQAALNSVTGSMRLSGTYEITDMEEADYSYGGNITTIYATDNYYSLDESIFGVIELVATNENGKAMLVALNDQNVVEKTAAIDGEGVVLSWASTFANPLKNLSTTDFEKKADGTYAVTNAAVRTSFGIVAYGYSREMSEVTLKVTNDTITKISFLSALYTDYGATMQDSGEVIVNNHGTATVPVIAPKPVVAEHAQLTEALSAMGNNFTMAVTETMDAESFAYNNIYTETAYYSDAEVQVNEDEPAVYETFGYFDLEGKGVYQFSKTEAGVLSLVENYPTSSVSDLLEGYFSGFNVALLESKGNGVFTAYDDTAHLVGPYLVLDSYAADTVVKLSIEIADGHISKINYMYDIEIFGMVLGSVKVEAVFSSYGTSSIDFSLETLAEEALLYASFDESYLSSWMNADHSISFSKIGIVFDDIKATEVIINEGNISFKANNVVYTAVVEGETLKLSTEGAEDIVFEISSVKEVNDAIADFLGITGVTLPNISPASYVFQTGTDEEGYDVIVVVISQLTIDLDGYLTAMEEAGFLVGQLEGEGYGAYDEAETIWIQVYEGEVAGTIELYIWNY